MLETYTRLKGYGTPPYLNFDLSITFRSLASGKRYRYDGKITMYEDCQLPNQRRFAVGPEAITEIPAR
jgi:hypothetical protein